MSPPRQSRYDAIVIGAGANGLVAAHYLARAGKRVLVVEQRESLEAGLDVGWVPAQVVRELQLDQHGFRLEQPDPWVSVSLDGAGGLQLWREMSKSVEAIRRISPADAAQWPEFCERMRTLASVLEKLYLAPPPDIETRDPRELARIGGLGLFVRRLGKQAVIDLARILPMSIADLLDEWFESDILKGVLGAVGVWHLKQGPRSGGTAFNFLHHHVGCALGVFRPPQSNLREALAAAGGVGGRSGPEMMFNNEAALCLASDGRAAGVTLLQRREQVDAPLVVSSESPRAALSRLGLHLDPEFVRAVDHIKCRGVVAHARLSAEYAARVRNRCVAPSLEYLERAYDDAKYGRDSHRPYVETDGAGRVHIQYVPFTDQQRDVQSLRTLGSSVADALGVPAGALTIETPDDLEREYNLTEGHLYHGELTLDQILFMRPVPGWSRYRTPIEGLYLCGSGTHPGGGIPGAAGRNAAREIL